MSKPMRIGGYLIVELEDQLSAADAFSELIDNALDAAATKIEIIYTRRSMTICDNGKGCDDPNLIATPSQSASRFNPGAIGSKAIGAKQACATFGRIWDIHTVPHRTNRYHHYRLVWDENGPLPNQYEGKGQPAHSAPKDIRNGGTKIVVTGRQDGFAVLQLDSICRRLEARYRPGLHSKALTIVVRNPEQGTGRQLQNAAYDSGLFVSPIHELQGTIGSSHAFSVRYGTLKENHRVLSNCHLIFGPRVIRTINTIGTLALPAACYIDVNLSEGWKRSLSTNKIRLVRYENELLVELERMLGLWINAQKTQAITYKVHMLEGRLSSMMNDRLAYVHQASNPGTHQPAPAAARKQTAIESKAEEQITVVRRKRRRRRDRRAVKGGNLAAWQQPQPKATELKVEFDAKLNRDLFAVSYNNMSVVVRLNIGPHQRDIVNRIERGKSEDDLYQIAVMAFAFYVGTNKPLFGSLFACMRARGYEIDVDEEQSDITTMVANCLLDAAYEAEFSVKKKLLLHKSVMNHETEDHARKLCRSRTDGAEARTD